MNICPPESIATDGKPNFFSQAVNCTRIVVSIVMIRFATQVFNPPSRIPISQQISKICMHPTPTQTVAFRFDPSPSQSQ